MQIDVVTYCILCLCSVDTDSDVTFIQQVGETKSKSLHIVNCGNCRTGISFLSDLLLFCLFICLFRFIF